MCKLLVIERIKLIFSILCYFSFLFLFLPQTHSVLKEKNCSVSKMPHTIPNCPKLYHFTSLCYDVIVWLIRHTAFCWSSVVLWSVELLLGVTVVVRLHLLSNGMVLDGKRHIAMKSGGSCWKCCVVVW